MNGGGDNNGYGSNSSRWGYQQDIDENSVVSRSLNRSWLRDENSQNRLQMKMGKQLEYMDIIKDMKVEEINVLQKEKAWLMNDRVDDYKVYFKVIESKRKESIGEL